VICERKEGNKNMQQPEKKQRGWHKWQTMVKPDPSACSYG